MDCGRRRVPGSTKVPHYQQKKVQAPLCLGCQSLPHPNKFFYFFAASLSDPALLVAWQLAEELFFAASLS